MELGNSLISINGEQTPTLEILFMLTVLMLLPSIVVMMTSFLRIIIILSFTRTAIGVQQTPPNIVLVHGDLSFAVHHESGDPADRHRCVPAL